MTTAIAGEATTRAAADTTEATARAAADTTLTTAIASEATTRAAADTTLAAADATETAARIAAVALKVALAGDTMTGFLTLHHDPTSVLHAATKQYVDAAVAAVPGVSDGDKGDIVVSAAGATWTIDADTVTYAKMQNVSATSRLLGRKTAGAGDPEELTLSDLLDFIGSAAQGDILYRGASGWARLGAGTTGLFLKTLGAGANPAWAAPAAGTGGGLFGSQLTAVPTVAGTGLSNLEGTGAASADTASGVRLSGTSGGFGAYTTSVPGTPYSIIALLATNTGIPGIGWTDGTKHQFIYAAAGGENVIVQSNSTVLAFSANNATITAGTGNAKLIWMKIRDDGTNVSFGYSNDGVNFFTAYTVAKASGYLGGSGYSHIFVGSPGGVGAQDTVIMSWLPGV